jgi:hypothetical protein
VTAPLLPPGADPEAARLILGSLPEDTPEELPPGADPAAAALILSGGLATAIPIRPAPLVNRLRERKRGRGVREQLIAGAEKGLDILARSEYAVASGLRAALHDSDEDVAQAALAGLRGQSKITFMDIAAEELGMSEEPFFTVPNVKYVPDFLEHITRAVGGWRASKRGSWYSDPGTS